MAFLERNCRLLGLFLVWAVIANVTVVTSTWHAVWNRSCFGTTNGVAHGTDKKKEIKTLREMYTNCTTVHGNLEIVGMTMNDLKQEGLESLDFFENVEEVFGYVLIGYTLLPRISFPRLRIIWGDNTFSAQTFSTSRVENFSLLVLSSNIDVIDFRSLRGVMEGRVGAINASGLCHWKTNSIDWKQVLGPDYQRKNRFVMKSLQNDTCFKDEPLENNCTGGCEFCWGPEPEHCQEIYRTGCAPQCANGMCFNTSDPNFCCSPECAAGCTGPRNDQCIGCRAMRDDGFCVDKCPQREVYNVKRMEYVHNPDGKYHWVRDCVKECPEQLYIYKDGCVARCPEGYFADSNETECKRCDGPCPKTCSLPDGEALNSHNINKLVNCTVIDGHLEIRPDTMGGGVGIDNGKDIRFGSLTEEELEVLSGVERITHYLFVQVETSLTSLKFLRNLKQIDGRKKFQERYAFYMTRTEEIREFGLSSLKTILDGDVYINNNPDLCYYYTLPWKKITVRGIYDVGPRNRDKVFCEKQRLVCDDMCDGETGCWAKGPNMCFSCQYFKANQTCVRDCGQFENMYPKDKVCKHCHDQCIGCKGPGPKNCISCRNVLLDNTCVETCPIDSHYENKTEKRCALCDTRCLECTGPSNIVGSGGCTKCRYAVVHSAQDNMTYCLDERDCQSHLGLEDFHAGFAMSVGLQAFAVKACLPCHSACNRCASYGADEEKPSQCECKIWRLLARADFTSGTCVLERPRNTYNESNNLYPCHRECEECFGPEANECVACRNFADYSDRSKNQFTCVEVCPPERSLHTKEYECTNIDLEATRTRHTQVISGVVLAAVFLALIIVCTILFVWRRRVRAMKYLPPNEVFEMHPEAKPNLARLRLILESELKKGPILGYGAFGTVFRGVWYADEKKTKILVAIKVLHESNPAAQKEMLDEAGMMASMENQYLVQLIGVCVGQQLMLVTPLFPLGNLLDYVQGNRFKIGSLALLRWCTQIANGMSYLEECRLVHRDLAARNVLVQTPYHVRITDFGLAKMLEYGQEELKIFEGKMPIKWLALECIQQKRYTHKSDVWAYGVTVWELLTFGEKPYRDVPLQQIPYLLEQGVRLPQPQICSMDIYLILINCWMVDANSRYTFKELVEKFSHMMKDPGRYLAIEGDALMRLPSYTSSDRRNMLEQMATEEDEESLREANDFLRGSVSTPGTPISPLFPLLRDSGADSGAIAPHIVQEAARIRPGARRSTSSHRYASDPVKRVKAQSYLGKPTVVFEATTDVDNYLVPDSQQRPTSSDMNDFSAAAPLSTSKGSLVYTPVLGEDSGVDELGMDYYVYLRKSDGSQEGMAWCDNREYMLPKKNPEDEAVSSPLMIDAEPSHRSPETETVV